MMIDRNEKGETIMNLKKGIGVLLAGPLGRELSWEAAARRIRKRIQSAPKAVI